MFGLSLRPVAQKVSSLSLCQPGTTIANSSVSPVHETHTDRWKRQRSVKGVLGVHVDDLVGGGSPFFFQKAVQWIRTELEFGTWEQSRFLISWSTIVIRKPIKISMSKFAQEMEPVAVPKHVRDDLDAPLDATIHSQFRESVCQLPWLQLQKITPVVCQRNIAKQVRDSQRS